MLWTISMILLVLWFLGLVSGGTVGSWVHLLLVFSLVSFVLAFFTSMARPGPAPARATRYRN
jgi:hypothetical protein